MPIFEPAALPSRLSDSPEPSPSMMHRISAVSVLLLVVGAPPALADGDGGAYQKRVAPFLNNYCAECHGGKDPEQGLRLEPGGSDGVIEPLKKLKMVEEMISRLRVNDMPPADYEKQPGPGERQKMIEWLRGRVDQMIQTEPNPGRVLIRRLTRTAYRNTVRDLLGVQVDVSDFPSDTVAHGFDNLAKPISLPPLLMERYVNAAERVSEKWYAQQIAGTSKAPQDSEGDRAAARQVLEKLMFRAYRRPLRDGELAGMMELFDKLRDHGFGYKASLRGCVEKVLLSPHFLYRIEKDPPIGQDRKLNDFELATRLSYFLWSSMPDERLFGLAREGELQTGHTLRKEIRRMLRDPKLEGGLVGDFAAQWLQVQRLRSIHPDEKMFPEFDPKLRAAMRTETLRLFERVVRRDLSIMKLLTADYTFVNERLAEHYGMEGVEGDRFRKVSLAGTRRRGVMTHAGVLAINSHPTRISPVRRGKWILKAVLGDPPPPPVANAGALEAVEKEGTLRERLEAHRSNPNCASCHKRMDALGFAFQHFDPVGRWRKQDRQGRPIDASAKLDDTSFDGAKQLIETLRQDHAAEYRRNLVRQMLKYAIGRKLKRPDRQVVRRIARDVAEADNRMSAVIDGVARSLPFRQRRNPGRLGVEKLPGALGYEVSGNPAQQIVLTLKPWDSGGGFPKDRVSFEVHTRNRLHDAVGATGTEVEVGEPEGGGDEPYRYPLTAPVGEPIHLMFMRKLIGPNEYATDFLMPIKPIPETDMNASYEVADWSGFWRAPLRGPKNPRPGTLYSFDFDLTLVAKKKGRAKVWLNNNRASNHASFSSAGGFRVTGEGKHRLTQVGRRKRVMIGSASPALGIHVRTRPQTVVSNVSPIRFIRPKLGLTSREPIELGPVGPSETARSERRAIFNAQEKTLTGQRGNTWRTLLYGTARLFKPEPVERSYRVRTKHVGVEMVGKHAGRFELLGEHTQKGGAELKLIGPDGEPGLAGGKDPEKEPLRVRFKGAPKPGRYEATVRIVTQAGGVGTRSKGGEGEPKKGQYYVDVPVTATVE